MTEFEMVLFELIRAAASGSPREIPATVDQVALYRTVRRLHLASLLWDSASRLPASPVRDAWEKERDAAALKDLMQTEEKETVDRALSEAGIRFLYLKGSVLKSLWGDPSFRYMGDADFLYEGDDHALKRALEGVGYAAVEFVSRDYSHHHIFKKEPWFILEPHYALFNSDDPFADTLAGIFDRATPDPALPGRYLISVEDLYLHCLFHLRKHIAGGGIGVRSFLDFAFLLRAYPDLPERERVVDVLSRCGLSGFEERVLRIARLLSDPSLSPDEEDEAELCALFKTGLFGSLGNKFANQAQTERGRSRFPRLRVFLRHVFPPLVSLAKKKFRAPLSWLLYPFFWFRRFFLILFSPVRRKRTGNAVRVLKSKDSEDGGRELRYFGLIQGSGDAKGGERRE